VRTPLSWLRDFAPFEGDPAELAATLDDLGLVVESLERIGEGLDDVVVARVHEVGPIEGADRIRRVVVDAGGGQLEIVCGAWNFSEGDLVALAPAGTTLPGGLTIARRRLKGVVSEGMLCSPAELGLSEDAAGLLVLSSVEGARPGQPVGDALGLEPDVVFDITVEGNRPDAWCVAGIARDLAGRLGLPFAWPEPAPPAAGPPAARLASAEVLDPDLCPRLVVTVLSEVVVAPSPAWMARRLALAGMRSINNVVDASNYVMLELGQPTHPYDLDRLGGRGLRVRRARPGEVLVTLDGTARTLGRRGLGLGDTGEDCVICDAEDQVVGVAGIMGGTSTEISATTSVVLLEAAYFEPMVIARTSKRLGLRTEASARFERGCDPWRIDRAAARFCELVPGRPAGEPIDRRGLVPRPFEVGLEVRRVNELLGTDLGAPDVARLIGPLGFACRVSDGSLTVTVPTDRPDVRPPPFGVDDVVEEVARTYGYSRLPRRQPSWPQPGGLSAYQRDRRTVREVLCGLGAFEAWTPSFVADEEHRRIGLVGPAVAVANPLVSEERFLRRALLPGLLAALAYNGDRRQGELRLFETGTVFVHPEAGAARVVERSGHGGAEAAILPAEREMAALVLAKEGDDARTAVAAWSVLAETLRLAEVALGSQATAWSLSELAGLHPTRSAPLLGPADLVVGAVGEVDPAVLEAFGIVGRVGWLEVDLGRLLDGDRVPRRRDEVTMPTRFPSSDIDLAFLVDDDVPAGLVTDTLRTAGGELLESVSLFDVFRGEAVGPGRRSLAFRLRFSAPDRTLTDAEVGAVRQASIEAVTALGAQLR
jgi:phenylalanyl-tRNA synthetase beta chain